MGNASVQRGLFFTFRLFSLIRHALRRATFPVGEGDLRRGRVHRGPAVTVRCPLHTRPGLRPVHPLQAGEGRNPSSVRAFGPATLSVGEGDLPAGVNTLSWERVAGPKALTGVGRYRV